MDPSDTPATSPDPAKMSPEAAARAERYWRSAVRVARARTAGAPWLADEVESAAYVWVCEAAAKFDPDRNDDPEGFIHYRVMCGALNLLRRHRRRGFAPIYQAASGDDGDAPDWSWEPSAPDPSLDAVDDRDEAEHAMQGMAPRSARLLRMIHMDGLNGKEAAAVEGVDPSWVSKLCKASIGWARERREGVAA